MNWSDRVQDEIARVKEGGGSRLRSRGQLLFVRRAFVMLAQQVLPKIVFEITPDGVNVVRIVLGIVVFQQKRRALHAIIMAFLWLDALSPSDIMVFGSTTLDPFHFLDCQFR